MSRDRPTLDIGKSVMNYSFEAELFFFENVYDLKPKKKRDYVLKIKKNDN